MRELELKGAMSSMVRRVPAPAILWAVLVLGCAESGATGRQGPGRTEEPAGTAAAGRYHRGGGEAERTMDLKKEAQALKAELSARHGPSQEARISRGIDQAAAQWREADGDFPAFVREHFIADPKTLDATFERLEAVFEELDGRFLEMSRALRRATDLDTGPLLPLDPLLSAYDPSAHESDDLFRSRIAIVVLLNFPQASLEEKLRDGPGYSRRRWAEVRLAGRFASRVPGDVQQEVVEAGAKADLYIARYNIWMHHLLDDRGERLFPIGLRLISHWNLRDELRAAYADPSGRGTDKQRMIVQVMSRIVEQTIPAAVIDNPRLDWSPRTNRVSPSPAEEVEEGQAAAERPPGREPDTRYERLLAQFRAARRADPYTPIAPSQLRRSFELQREIPEERVKAMLAQVLESPLVRRVGALIGRRLGRKLEPQDLWYSGFVAAGKHPGSELDLVVRKRYPTREDFAADIPRILEELGFSKDRAGYLASHIVVDASRGAGHALPAARRGDFPHLRTRVEKDGMNYKGYNIAIHELGHNVEQVFSLYDVDHTLLAGVPNNAFTEALAFVFQARDLELLGLSKPDPESERMRVLNDFWQTWEIAGVALVDTAVWHWMYEHPQARPAELREAVMEISRDLWNRHFEPVLGGKGSLLLGIYSHMIAHPLYLPDYPLGHLIAFQIEEQVKKSGSLGSEFERMARQGAVIPDLWMRGATGAPVGPEPLLRATEAALAAEER